MRRTGQMQRATWFVFLAGLALVLGCSGDTDGGSGGDAAGGSGNPGVSDGGSGGSIKLSFPEGEELNVADTTGFFVELKDKDGQPLSYVRIFCESEKGIAIIEPSSNGVAFENTGPDGKMSGRIGGLLPGSYIMECRAPQGYNLVARAHLKIRGDIPVGFEGFPGAAGGNLGGGVNPVLGGINLISAQFNDAGSNGSGLPIDLTQNPDCDGDTDTVDPEPFTFTQYQFTVKNGTAVPITVESVSITVQGIRSGGGNVRLPAQGQTVKISANGSGTVTGLFWTPTSGLAGTSVQPRQGTFQVAITITGVTSSGEEFSVTETASVSFDFVDNCSTTTTG